MAKGEELQEFELFRMRSGTEYEANAFAAHVLIDTDECLEYARGGYDLRLPMEPRSDFFRNVRPE